MVRDFRSPRKWMPGTIKTQSGPVSYQIELEDGQIVRRHIDHIRLRSCSASSNEDTPFRDRDKNFEFFDSLPSFQTPEAESDEAEERQPTRRYPLRDRRPPDRLMNWHI